MPNTSCYIIYNSNYDYFVFCPTEKCITNILQRITICMHDTINPPINIIMYILGYSDNVL